MSSIRITTGQHLRCVTGQTRNQRPENPHLTMLEGGKSRDEGAHPDTEPRNRGMCLLLGLERLYNFALAFCFGVQL